MTALSSDNVGGSTVPQMQVEFGLGQGEMKSLLTAWSRLQRGT